MGKRRIGFNPAVSGRGHKKTTKANAHKHNINNYGYGYGYNRGPQKTRPEDTQRKDKMSIVFFDEKTLNKMTEHCLPAAKDSEFQIHYRAANVHIQKDGFEVIFSIPTAYYNFTQEVSGSAVEYDLNDIDEQAEAVKETSSLNLHGNIKQLPLFQALSDIGYEVTFKEGNFGSIHRHPGRFGFSSIDLGKNPDSPGVIYRNHTCTDLVQTDSVMYIDGKQTEIYTTEARIVNVKGAADGGVEGDYCQIPTLSIIKPESTTSKVDPACSVLGDMDADIFGQFHFVGAFGAEARKYPLLEAILNMLNTFEYNVCTENVKVERITQRYQSWGGYGKGKGSHAKVGNTYPSIYGGGFDDDYDLMMADYWDGMDATTDRKSFVTPQIVPDAAAKKMGDPNDALTEEALIKAMLGQDGIDATEEDIEAVKDVMAGLDDDEQQAMYDYVLHVEDSTEEEKAWRGW